MVALNANWEVPVAYFLIDSLNTCEKANLVHCCLMHLEETGIIIKTLTFDGCSTNLSMCYNLGAKLS